ncbi:unnamed protein product [Fusarium graminearum]|nr:unnamed protein product [Fusarium graminearum]
MPEATVLDVRRRLNKMPEDPANGPLRVEKITIKDDEYELITHPKEHVLAIDDDDDDDWDDCEAPLTVADTTSPKVVDNSAALESPAPVNQRPEQPLVNRINNKKTKAQVASALQFLQPEIRSKNYIAPPTEDFQANQAMRDSLSLDTVGKTT